MINFIVAGGVVITFSAIGLSIVYSSARHEERQKREAKRAREERRNAEVEIIRHRERTACHIAMDDLPRPPD